MEGSKNYAFIDSQNLNLGMRDLNWKLDHKRFRIYLREKYSVVVAYLFIGYVPENKELYISLQKAGYVLKFKPTLSNKGGGHKGNVDADLVLQATIDFYKNNFAKAIVVTSDGDFYSLVNFLYQHGRLAMVISPCKQKCSTLLKKMAKERIIFLDNLRKKLEYKKIPFKDETLKGILLDDSK